MSMPARQTRRRFLITLSGAGAAGLVPTPRGLAAGGSLETTSVRLFKSSLICSAAPQYAAEELLRAEGFKDIAYIEAARNALPQVFADGRSISRSLSPSITYWRLIAGRRSRSSPAFLRVATSY